ncbi:MAG: DUF5606 domain-containing protein [Bacteroidetes bacterium]|nr:DUF5606 domain-containing protein [Bacteroidota bacterium]MBK9424871.1 DUF5606 domain-containing protein [Bacteroidota bacterium]MBL0070616.1 DUF5606 domain-containing protein [Bacteroidota bacterium]
MSLKGIISIAGFPGLYKVLAQSKSGFIVESLSDKKRLPVSSTQRISMLEDISVFTLSDDLPLTQVLLKMKETETANPPVDAKSDPVKLRDYFRSLISDFDSERVYPSDIKKIITWYHLVKDIVDIPDPEEAVAETEAEPVNEAPEATSETAETPKKKRATKAKEADDSAAAEKPAKAPRKKKEN